MYRDCSVAGTHRELRGEGRLQHTGRTHIDGAAAAPAANTARGGAINGRGEILFGGKAIADQPSGARGNG